MPQQLTKGFTLRQAIDCFKAHGCWPYWNDQRQAIDYDPRPRGAEQKAAAAMIARGWKTDTIARRAVSASRGSRRV